MLKRRSRAVPLNIPRWCNGRTAGFGPACRGSSPWRGAILLIWVGRIAAIAADCKFALLNEPDGSSPSRPTTLTHKMNTENCPNCGSPQVATTSYSLPMYECESWVSGYQNELRESNLCQERAKAKRLLYIAVRLHSHASSECLWTDTPVTCEVCALGEELRTKFGASLEAAD